MERFGYVVVNNGVFKHINPTIFKTFSDCVKSVLSEEHDVLTNIFYFKILKTSEIVKMIHEKPNDKKFGFCYLLKCKNENHFTVHNAQCELENNLFDIVMRAKKLICEKDKESTSGCSDLKMKIGYFKILTDEDFLSEIHNL